MKYLIKGFAIAHGLMAVAFLYLLNQSLIDGSVWGVLFTTPLMVGCIISSAKLSVWEK